MSRLISSGNSESCCADVLRACVRAGHERGLSGCGESGRGLNVRPLAFGGPKADPASLKGLPWPPGLNAESCRLAMFLCRFAG